MAALRARFDRFMTRYFTCPSITYQQSFNIVIPHIAEHLFSTLFGLLNTGMISSSGVTSLSAVSLVDSLNSFLFVFFQGISTGAGVIVANYRGRGEPDKLHEASVQAVTSVTLFAALTSIFIILFNAPLLKLLFGAAEQEVMDKARLYMLGGALSLPLQGVTLSLCGVLRGIGEGKTTLVYTIISTILYVLLNILFLTILGMGIPGLIISISLSRLLNVPLLLCLMYRRHSTFRFRFKELFHVNLPILKSIMKVGLPCATESLFFTGGRLVTQTIIVPMGTNAIVTYNIAYSIMMLNQALTGPVNTSMYAIVGICMGNKRPDDARRMTKSFFCLNTVSFVVALGLVMLFFNYLVRFYNAPQEIIPLIFKCVLIAGICHPFLHNLAFMLPAVFRAAGDGTFCTVFSLLVMWGVRVLGGYVLGTLCGMGVFGVWMAQILDWVPRATVYLLRFRGDRWLRHKLISD